MASELHLGDSNWKFFQVGYPVDTPTEQGGGGGGGGRRGGVWFSHPCVKEAATTALFGVLNQSARHLRTLSPTSSSSDSLKGECFCCSTKP